MAFRATSYWRSMLNRLGGNRSFASSTTPKMTPSTIGASHADPHRDSRSAMLVNFTPLCVLMGMMLVGLTIGTHTAVQQLRRSPNVYLNKKRRKSVPEVEDPDRTVASADKFINKSFFRKVAHVQEHNRTLPDPSRPNPFTRPRNAETLKTVGIDPRRNIPIN